MVRRIVRDPPAGARQGVRDVQHPDGFPIRPLTIVHIAKGRSVFVVEGALRLVGGQAQSADGQPSAWAICPNTFAGDREGRIHLKVTNVATSPLTSPLTSPILRAAMPCAPQSDWHW